MTASRNPGTAPMVQTFAQAARIKDPVERRAWLLDKFQELYDQSANRFYLNKSGEQIPNPDGSTAFKVLAAITALLDQSPELDQHAREAKLRLVAALENLPALVSEPSAIEQKRAVLAVLKDAAIVAALKPNADVNGAVGTFRVVAQVLNLTSGDADDDVSDDDLKTALRQLEGKKR